MELSIYIGLTVVLTTLVVYGLCRAFIRPVEEVVEVRETVRYERETLVFHNEIIIEDDYGRMPADKALDRAYRRGREQLVDAITKDMIRTWVIDVVEPNGPQKILNLQILVMPPKNDRR